MELDSTPVVSRIANLGMDSAEVYVVLTSQSALFGDSSLVLSAGEIRDIGWGRYWQLPPVSSLEGDSLTLQISLSYWGLEPDPDTLSEETTITFDLRERTNVFGAITGQHDVSTVPAHIDFYCEGYPDSVWTSVDISAGESYTNGIRPLLAGSNRMVITTPLRYMNEDRSFVTIPGNTDPFDIWLTSSDVILIDDDNGADYQTYIVSSLDQLSLNTRVVTGAPTAEMSLAAVERIVWMTGDDATTTLTTADQTLLTNYLSAGGGLLLTGQNITDDPANEQFLADVLHCQPDRDDTDRPRAYGIGGLPPVDGQFLLLLGSQGAGNQNSPSSLIPLDGGTICFLNDTTDLEMCGVYGVHGLGKFIFLSFGLEAASGMAGSTSRAEFLDIALNAIATDVPDGSPPIPSQLYLEPAYPNPFNSSVEIVWTAPIGALRMSLEVYDVLGRRVAELFQGQSPAGTHRVTWAAADEHGIPVSSGTYFVRLHAPAVTQVRTIRLVR
ncbi:MAG: T9SS type A sorting domain-containing protein [bacterium]|nr:T9SS type A sorting domain-containing protein [bacterium]